MFFLCGEIQVKSEQGFVSPLHSFSFHTFFRLNKSPFEMVPQSFVNMDVRLIVREQKAIENNLLQTQQ